jgi:choice-of-anchor B domain-containing protein
MRLLFTGALALTAVALFSHGSASATAAMPQGTTNADTSWTAGQPLTGRAIPCEGGKIKTFECQNVELLSYLPADGIGRSAGYDLWGWHDSTTGREFVIIGGSATAFVEVTDPVNPRYLGVLPPHGGLKPSAAQSVKVYKNYALVGYEAVKHGIQIFDLTQLRDVKTPPVVFQETAHYDGVANTHTITMNQETGFAYINGSNTCGGGLHMIDVRTPTKPSFAGCFTEPATGGLNGNGYVHDAQCVVYRGPDQPYKGREICMTSSGGSLGIADVTDKKQPKTISIARYPNIGYTHQGWFTEDQRYFFVDDELDENPGALAFMQGRSQDAQASPPKPTRTIVFDMSDLDDPVVLTEFFHTTTATDHNLYIRGRYMYQGNYGAGLRILDVVDPKNPKEVGYLTKAGKAWGTYPYFKNDVVAVSTTSGLVLARLLKR